MLVDVFVLQVLIKVEYYAQVSSRQALRKYLDNKKKRI